MKIHKCQYFFTKYDMFLSFYTKKRYSIGIYQKLFTLKLEKTECISLVNFLCIHGIGEKKNLSLGRGSFLHHFPSSFSYWYINSNIIALSFVVVVIYYCLRMYFCVTIVIVIESVSYKSFNKVSSVYKTFWNFLNI